MELIHFLGSELVSLCYSAGTAACSGLSNPISSHMNQTFPVTSPTRALSFLTREVADGPFLEIFKVRLDGTLGNLI